MLKTLLLGIATFVVSSGAFAQEGDLQITCPPGFRIYLDGRFMGLSTVAEDGKYLSSIAAVRWRKWRCYHRARYGSIGCPLRAHSMYLYFSRPRGVNS